MNNYELYIDGALMELDSKFGFPLVYSSPIFTDISKIVSNGTYTVKLPKTANNRCAIDNCQMPDNVTPYPYKLHSTDLWKNGIPIIQKGTMVLLEIGEYIEIAIIWGNGNITEVLGNQKLRYMWGDYFVWWLSSGQDITSSNENGGFARSDFGQGTRNYHYQHPFVSYNWLLNRISNVCGLSFVFPDNVLAEKEQLYIPLVEKNPNEETFSGNSIHFTIDTGLNIIPSTGNTGAIEVDGNSFKIKEDCELYFEGQWTFLYGGGFDNAIDFEMVLSINGDGAAHAITDASYEGGSYRGTINFNKEILSIGANKGDVITYKLLARRVGNIMVDIQSLHSSDGELKVIPETQYVTYGSRYPIIPNLPDITCLEVLKNIMSLFGLFAYYDISQPNTIKLFSIDEIYERKSIAKDWTDKLISGNNLDSIKYTFQDYAQENYIRYLKDDSVRVNADGSIKMENETLEKEKDIVELKFAASEMRSGLIHIPLYTRERDGEIVYNKSSNRIAKMDIGATSSTATFPDTLFFSGENGIIKRRYSKYQEILRRPKVVTGDFLLKELDLYNIDLITPIYLEQTGRYYAIIDIKTGEEKSTCRLLQM